jgi:protein-S-isoprenylcysteine O-methyltransferase Ste14
MNSPTTAALITLGGVLLCWVGFVSVFIFRTSPGKPKEAKRNRTASFGIALQMFGYGSVFFRPPHRPFLPPVAALAGVTGVVYGVVTVAIAAASLWLISAAVRRLGKQWAVAARLVEGHNLIIDGPYSFVRNPIYVAMFGMLVASGLALEHWIALALGVVFFAAGTFVRIRTEEKLLRAAFGKEFDDYAARVPAVLPRIF